MRVLDLASYIAGPLASMTLGDLGADVLKIEAPKKGDPLRSYGERRLDTSLTWVNVNRNKRSLRLDLKSTEGRAAILDLLGGADIVICNWRPGVAESLELSDERMRRTNPRLIRCYITGYGPSGPLANHPAFDGLLQVASALAAIQGGPERPELVNTMVADKTTATVATQAVLAQLYRRERTGTGGRIDVAMLDTMAWFVFPDSMKTRTFLDSADDGDVSRVFSRRSTILTTADGYLAIAPVSGAQIGRTCDALGHPEWKIALKAIRDPVELANTLLDWVEGVTATKATAHWCTLLEAADVPVAPVVDIDGHFRHPQIIHNDVYTFVDNPQLGSQRMVRYPARFEGVTLPLRPPPSLGEHDGSSWRG